MWSCEEDRCGKPGYLVTQLRGTQQLYHNTLGRKEAELL